MQQTGSVPFRNGPAPFSQVAVNRATESGTNGARIAASRQIRVCSRPTSGSSRTRPTQAERLAPESLP